jgi:hypothetical protein
MGIEPNNPVQFRAARACFARRRLCDIDEILQSPRLAEGVSTGGPQRVVKKPSEGGSIRRILLSNQVVGLSAHI